MLLCGRTPSAFSSTHHHDHHSSVGGVTVRWRSPVSCGTRIDGQVGGQVVVGNSWVREFNGGGR